MDTIIGGATQSEAILTLTERKTNYLLIRKLPKGKDSGGVVKEVFKALLPFKDILKTITTDNGSEFAAHEEITKKIRSPPRLFYRPLFFMAKGAIENANKLIRQYIPKKKPHLKIIPMTI